MLNLLEETLFNVLKEVAADTIGMSHGPDLEPGKGDKQKVSVSVSSLNTSFPTENEKILAARDPSWLSQTYSWDTDGKKTSFKLPKSIQGDIAEVEAPAGHAVKSGDDYFIEDKTLQFYRPPPKGKPGVIVYLKGSKAKGYREAYPCQLNVLLNVWAQKIEDADGLFNKTFNVLLSSFVDLEIIRSKPDESGVSLRLLKLATVPETISRSFKDIGGSGYYNVTAKIAVLGELEVTVALGKAEPESVIEDIIYQTNPVKT